MNLFRPTAFNQFSEVVAAHSLRSESLPAKNSMLPKGATDAEAASNRAAFAQELGFDSLAAPLLEHGDTVYELAGDYDFATRPTADAIMTDKAGRLIGIGVADCIVVLLYDPQHNAVAAVHSGWRGTLKEIAPKAIKQMSERYGTDPQQLIAYLSPNPARFEYGIDAATADQFDGRYTSPKSDQDKWLDNKLAVHDQLLAAGLTAEHIEADPRSNYGPEFHSYRRDRDNSGRHMVVIGLKA